MIEGLGRYGIALTVDDALEAHAAAVERMGYSAVWLAGGQLASLEPLLRVLRATERIAAVPGIIPMDVHGAAAIRELYAEAERIAPGRLQVGIGGPQRQRTGALAALAGLLDELDPVVPVQRRFLAALGPRKLELARQRTGGAVTLLADPAATAWTRERLGNDATLVVDQMAVLHGDPSTARATARGPLGFLAQVPGYAASFARMGFSERDIRELSDDLVDAAVARGGVEQVVARVREQEAAGADHVVIALIAAPDGPDEVTAAERLAVRLQL